MAAYQMGRTTLAVPMKLFRQNREKVCNALQNILNNCTNSFILLEGGKDISFNDTDININFRQESYFQYMFGVKEPGCFGCVRIDTFQTTLFVPRFPPEYGVWMGRLLSTDEYKCMYEVDEVQYVDQLDSFFTDRSPKTIYTLNGQNTDSGLFAKPATFTGIEKHAVDQNTLFPVIAECRVIKSSLEIEVLRYVAKVSSDAHIKVMQFMQPGRHEYEGESVFLHYAYAVGGCRHTSYTCICGSGENCSILHYGHAAAPNDKSVRDGDMCLFDMGANYCGYSADITCSFPANGKFTTDQKFIYNAVLDARNAVLKEARENVSWVDMHRLASRVMLERLKEGGLLKGDVDEMLNAGLPEIFQPHGLGHLLGLDVHDVGGYLENQPKRPKESWLSKLRFSRILKAGMYVTVEPGCYFISDLMDKAIADPNLNRFIDLNMFERFRNFGGVRIEDDVLITKNGIENFAIVPRTVEEIESVMQKRIIDPYTL